MGFKIAGIQMRCTPDKGRNLKQAIELGNLAAEQGAEIICFQELFQTHWFPRNYDPEAVDLAESIPGPTVDRMSVEAMKWNSTVIAPIYERDEQGRGFNSAVIINGKGEVLGTYRKVHVPNFDLWKEQSYFNSGNGGFPVFDLGFIRLGVLIGWDVFFPESARALTLGGAQLILTPTAAAFASHLRWEMVLRSHAITNGLYVLRVNRVGSEENQDFYGASFCADPEGELIGEPSGMTDGILLADIDLQHVENVRAEWNYLGDRRPDTYRTIVQE